MSQESESRRKKRSKHITTLHICHYKITKQNQYREGTVHIEIFPMENLLHFQNEHTKAEVPRHAFIKLRLNFMIANLLYYCLIV